MGMLRKVVIGSLVVGAARLAMTNRDAKRTGRLIVRNVRGVAKPVFKAAAVAAVAETLRGARKAKRSTSARKLAVKRLRSRAHART